MGPTNVVGPARGRFASFILLTLLFSNAIAVAAAALTHGPLVGDVRPDHVQIWIRTGAAASVAVSYGKPGEARITTPPVTTDAASDYTASLRVAGISAATAYEYQIVVDGIASALHTFTTAPADGDPGTFSIALVSDSFSSSYAPVYARIAEQAPAGFIIIGDHDHSNPGASKLGDAALNAMRAMHRRLRDTSTRLGTDFAASIVGADVPLILRQEDDHDSVTNDVSATAKVWPQVFQAWREYHPMLADNGLSNPVSPGMWQRTQRGNVAFVSLDLRSNRNAASGSAHTILGAAQKAWLTSVIYELADDPTVTWVALVSTVPFNPAQLKIDSWSGYPADRQWLVDTIRAAGLENVVILSGDCHWGSIDDGTHSLIPELNVPQTNTGFSNTCSNQPAQWTLNQYRPNPGFGLVTFGPDAAKLAIHGEDGSVKLELEVPSKKPPNGCVMANPSVSLVPAWGPSVAAGTTLTYAVSVTNNNSAGCTAVQYALDPTVPAGWTGALGSAALSLASGASATTTLDVTSASSASPGTYTLSLMASDSQAAPFSASASAQYVVAGSINAFADNFDRGDSTSMGSAWLESKGDLLISSGALAIQLSGDNVAVVPALSGAQLTAVADFAWIDKVGAPRFGIVLRYRDPQNYYLLYRQVGGTSRLYISKIVNGVETVLKYASITNPAGNTYFRIEGQASGTTLKLLLNGVEKLSVSDATFSAGSAGVLLGAGIIKSCRADNFSAAAL